MSVTTTPSGGSGGGGDQNDADDGTGAPNDLGGGVLDPGEGAGGVGTGGPSGGGGGSGGSGGGSGSALGPLNTAVIVVVVVVIGIIFILFGLAGPRSSTAKPMPDLTGKQIGLKFATSQLRAAGWRPVGSYDAYGEDRGIGDEKGWKVCFQDVKAGANLSPRRASLGAVQTDEACPVTNYGELQRIYDVGRNEGTRKVPNLTGYTPFMARQAFGENASITVLKLPARKDEKRSGSAVLRWLRDSTTKDLSTGRPEEVTGDPGDWLICSQDPVPDPDPAVQDWAGQVVTLYVVPIDDDVNRHRETACTGVPTA